MLRWLLQALSPSFQGVTPAYVPVRNVSIDSSTYETFIAILGERQTIVVRNGAYSADPCMNQQIVSGQTATASTSCSARHVEVAFGGSQWGAAICASATVPEIREPGTSAQTLLGQVEVIEYFAAFYNQEARVVAYVDDQAARLDCLTNLINDHVQNRSGGRVKALAIDYPSVASQWGPAALNVVSCPHYMCDALTRAGATVLNNVSGVGGYHALPWDWAGATQAEVVFSGILYSTDNATCSAWWNNTDAIPASVPARVNHEVFDNGAITDPSGGTDWFGSRVAKPVILVETLANILYPELNLRGGLSNVWWQNIYTESCTVPIGGIPTAAGLARQCVSPGSSVFAPGEGSSCAGLTATTASTVNNSAGSDSSDTDWVVWLLVGLVAVAVVVAVALGVMYGRSRREVARLTDDREPVMNPAAVAFEENF